MAEKLWTKNFTIITLGTVVSMLGNSIAGFALGLLVLDYTGSVFMYALYMVAYMLPRLIMPIIAGTLLDSFSRRKTIYTLDFISAGLYAVIFALLTFGEFNYVLFLALCLIVGSIDSIYSVAYDSFYPTLISEGNYRKAYSISSMIYPLASVMVLAAAYVYEKLGSLAPLFAFNAVTFLVAAIMETQIKSDETHIKPMEKYSLSVFKADLREGARYLKEERGLLTITLYFCINSLAFSGAETLYLPYFKSAPGLSVMTYTIVMGCGVLGRLIGGTLHYKLKYPPNRRFLIAVGVYILTSVIGGAMLYLPVILMAAVSFLNGALCVTSYNIRISSTQSYVPNERRGRFNGVFQMATTLGSMAGSLLTGVLGESLPYREIVLGFNVFMLLGVFVTMLPGRKQVEKIYNMNI